MVPIPLLGNLASLDLRNTSITAKALLDCLEAASSSTTATLVSFQSLKVNGDTWKDEHVDRFMDLVAMNQLQELDFTWQQTTTTSSNDSSSQISFDCLERLQRLSKLKTLKQGTMGILLTSQPPSNVRKSLL